MVPWKGKKIERCKKRRKTPWSQAKIEILKCIQTRSNLLLCDEKFLHWKGKCFKKMEMPEVWCKNLLSVCMCDFCCHLCCRCRYRYCCYWILTIEGNAPPITPILSSIVVPHLCNMNYVSFSIQKMKSAILIILWHNASNKQT